MAIVGRRRNRKQLLSQSLVQKSDKIFIAGHRGLVGSALIRKLERDGFQLENIQMQNNVIRGAREGNMRKLLFLGGPCAYPKWAP
jgi:nucleoside-diphosphate-sugar epimerase